MEDPSFDLVRLVIAAFQACGYVNAHAIEDKPQACDVLVAGTLAL
jgi:hypothetical protein